VSQLRAQLSAMQNRCEALERMLMERQRGARGSAAVLTGLEARPAHYITTSYARQAHAAVAEVPGTEVPAADSLVQLALNLPP
jgi:hypothetical protein